MDAADRAWHLSSTTPYDPPLTYGGWNQSKALGARIASLLRLLEEGQLDPGHLDSLKENGSSNGSMGIDIIGGSKQNGTTSNTKRHRLVIHSSPFLRCIQTSVGISAGVKSTRPRPSRRSSTSTQLAELTLGMDSASPSAQDYRASTGPSPSAAKSRKPLLRVDALLGEWRNPEYFEDIEPPPNSATMVVGAKADLLRRGEPIEISSGVEIGRGNFPGGWSRSNTVGGSRPPPSQYLAGSLPSDLAVPRRDRRGSNDSSTSRSSRKSSKADKTSSLTDNNRGIYVSPVPRYAIAPSDTIPTGYVAHARDACVEIDFQWDSMRAPQDWGDGGELGEEWSSMHKRLRRGFRKMLEWYKNHGVDSTQSEVPLAFPPEEDQYEAEDTVESEEEDVVLVLVTHGAPCNALIGALTNQPVLLDVGMASLTMAVRKDLRPSTTSRANTMHAEIDLVKRRRSSVDFGLSHDYEMKLIASTEHLRAGADPARIRSPKPADSFIEMGIGGRSMNAALGSIRRSTTTGANSRRWASPSPSRPADRDRDGERDKESRSGSVTGLWSRTPTTTGTATTPATATTPRTLDGLSDFETSPIETTFDLEESDSDSKEGKDEPGPLPMARSGSQGLWSAVPAGRGVPRRRWTVDQQ